ncbi:MAG: DHHA1 domain-containing protein [Thermoproteus sp.]
MYLKRLLDALGSRRKVAIVTHRHADLDALGCAEVLKDVLTSLGYEVVVVCPEGASREARPYAKCLGEVPQGAEAVVLADVASLSQVPEVKGALVLLFDHHAVGDMLPGVRDERPSCSEMALEAALEAGVKPSRDSLVVAALGVYFDTTRLLRADDKTLRALAYAVSEIGPLERYVGKQEEDPSLRIAKLKSLARLKVYRTSIGYVCATHVDAYEADVASMLVSAGCDVAIVASRRKDEVRIIYRSQRVDVGAMAARIGSLLGGSGGGHRGASVTIVKKKAAKAELPDILDSVISAIDPKAELISG